MSKESVSEILRLIVDADVLSAATFEDVDCDAVLDERDSDIAFESEWLRVHREVESKWSEDHELANVISEIAEAAFLATTRATRRHEIASYVADDFVLISKARVLGIHDEFLDCIWEAYASGNMCCPTTIKRRSP